MLVCTINFTAGDFTRVCVLLLGGKTRGRDTLAGSWVGGGPVRTHTISACDAREMDSYTTSYATM